MITSTGNAKVRSLVSLKRKAKERNAADVFLVEGIRAVREIPRDQLQEAYASETFAKSSAGSAVLEKMEAPVYLVSDGVFHFLSDTQTPQGIMAVVKQMHYKLEDLLGDGKGKPDPAPLAAPPLLVVLENMQDPGNLGTVIRTAEGAGVTGVLCGKGTADLYSPKAVRSTMGSIFRMPFLYTEDLERDIRKLKAMQIRIYAAHLEGSVDYCRPDYTKASAFLIGNEGRGLSPEAAALADERIRIPMHGHVESLNAAVSSALLMYEACRQRED